MPGATVSEAQEPRLALESGGDLYRVYNAAGEDVTRYYKALNEAGLAQYGERLPGLRSRMEPTADGHAALAKVDEKLA